MPAQVTAFPRSMWSFYCAIVASFGFAGFYADLLQDRGVPVWVVVVLFTTPVTVLITVHWGELPDRVVFWSHLFAATLYLLLAIGMEVFHLLGFQPEGSTFFRILAHLGWTFAWADVFRTLRQQRKSQRLK